MKTEVMMAEEVQSLQVVVLLLSKPTTAGQTRGVLIELANGRGSRFELTLTQSVLSKIIAEYEARIQDEDVSSNL